MENRYVIRIYPADEPRTAQNWFAGYHGGRGGMDELGNPIVIVEGEVDIGECAIVIDKSAVANFLADPKTDGLEFDVYPLGEEVDIVEEVYGSDDA